jgi:hypothetical protein
MKNALPSKLVLTLALPLLGAATLLAGCTMDPPGPSPVYSRLPTAQTQPPAPLSKDELERYNRIDQQALTESNQAVAFESAAQAYSQYYRVPVSVYGSYFSGGGGWGSGWGTGIGFGTGYWW